MKVCNTCGMQVNDNVAFCPNCGSHVPAPAQYQAPRQVPQQVSYQNQYREPAKEPVSVGGWIGRSLIPFIPIVGGIVYFIMLCIWSGDSHKEETFRNWARAQLIVMAITVVLVIIIFAVFSSFILEMANSMY